MPWSNKRFLLISICYFLPLVILVGIWFPVINHYYVPDVVITDKTLDLARSIPNDNLLDQIINDSKQQNNEAARRQLIDNAEAILKGEIKLKDCQTKNFSIPFSVDDIDKGLPAWQLAFASFRIPNILLNAYEVSRRKEFLIMAKDMIWAWASYERSAWLPKGLLWNDHAIAARVSVLAKFWRHYRNHPDYDSKAAKYILQLVGRSGRLLAKPSHFTFATNHGIIQNLALLEISLAFPFLPDAASYKQLSVKRLHDQMAFIVNDEGVVLEHSAGYQEHVLYKIGKIFRYLILLDLPIPEEWRSKYKRGIDFYAQLLSPDGSLPVYGDTRSAKNRVLRVFNMLESNGQSEFVEWKKECTDRRPHSLYPLAGYSIWWDGLNEWPNEQKLSQTVVAWSYFPMHAHKHADEMSVLLWADKHNWWTNTGYWPYGTKGRSEAESWAGSNAPHVVNEPNNSKRQTRLLGYGWSDSLAVTDLERKGPQEYIARRQVVHLKPNLWIVLDHTFGDEGQRTTTTWTTSYHVNLSKGEHPGSYILDPEGSNVKLTKFILTSEGAKISQFKGSFLPFAGWENHRPAPAIVIEQPANNSWAVAIWSLHNSTGPMLQFTEPPSMQYWKGPEKWKIVLPLSSSAMNIWREDNRIFFNEDVRGSDSPKEIILSETPQLTNKLADIHNGYENAAKKYPRKKYSMPRHLKAMYFVFIIFLLQEAFFLMYSRISRKFYTGLRALNLLGWIVGGIWLATM
jgi:hypothetical protein